MKRTTIIATVLVFGLALCGTTVAVAEELTIVGTGSGTSVLKAVGYAFSQKNPGVTVSVPKSIGSGGGIKAVGTDKNLIGRVARGIKDKEKHYGLTYVPYARNPIVIFANKSAGVTNLTTQQVCDIYSGKTTNWKEVGGIDAKIKVVRREDGDSSLQVLQKTFPGFKDMAITAKSKTTYSDPDTCELIENMKNTIAFGTYANARNYEVDVMSIDGKAPTHSVYPYVGILALIYKEKYNTRNVKAFRDFATSAGAHSAIEGAGAMPY